MYPYFDKRIAYGRIVRDRAACLREAHGPNAAAEAQAAAREPGISAGDRAFWEAVGARLAREGAAQPSRAPSWLPARPGVARRVS